jgi:hypothetical protein
MGAGGRLGKEGCEMWILTKEGLIVIVIVAVLGIVGLVLVLQPKGPVQAVAAAAPVVAFQPAVVPLPTEVATPSVPALALPVSAIDGVIYAGEYAHRTEANGFEIHWSNDARTLRVGLISPGMGYVAIGLDPVNRMEGANFILGAVTDGRVTVRDDFGTGPVAHSADTERGGTNDILDAAGCEANGKTYLEFAIPLDSGDPMDKPLSPGGTYKVLIAYHETDDDFGAWHSRRGSGSITLDP